MAIPEGFRQLDGSELQLGEGARLVGPADPSETLRVMITVRRRPGAPPLPDLAYWMATPPGQRRFLSVEEFGSTYGAARAELEEVASYVLSMGLTVTETSIARRTVIASGSVGHMNRAFAVELGSYKSGNETYRGLQGHVHVPSNIAPLVEGVFGLDNRRVGHNNSDPHTDPPSTTLLDAWTVAKLYNFPTNPANKQVIGIITVDGGGFTQSDLSTYFNNLNHINGTNLQAPVPMVAKGGVNNPGKQLNDFELTQDICVASTIAQGATILVFFESADSYGWIDFVKRASVPVAGDPQVDVISISNFICPADDALAIAKVFTLAEITALETAFQEAAVMGVTIFAACGDQGSQYDGRKYSVQWPASNPWVTACGGTTISYNGTPPPVEWVWNDISQILGPLATSGGISDKYALPDYQNGIVTQSSLNDNGVRRGLPDVAGNASPNSGYALWVDGSNINKMTNTPIVANGTSIVSPLYAGLAAVIIANVGHKIGFLNPTLYSLRSIVCRDIDDTVLSGSPVDNGLDGSRGYPSHKGWDACTGLGTIDGAALLWVIRSNKNKILDDISFKPNEDTNKFLDDVSLKFSDDGATNKALDDLSGGGVFRSAAPGLTVKAVDDIRIPGHQEAAPGTPFILATPHHAMTWIGAGGAWQGAPPSVYQALIAQYDAELVRLEQAMQKASSELQGLDAQYRQMLEAYRALVNGYLASFGSKTAAQDIGR